MVFLKCPLCCNQQFDTILAFREHLLYFTYRPLKCDVCQKSVGGIQDLTRHLESHLPEDKNSSALYHGGIVTSGGANHIRGLSGEPYDTDVKSGSDIRPCDRDDMAAIAVIQSTGIAPEKGIDGVIMDRQMYISSKRKCDSTARLSNCIASLDGKCIKNETETLWKPNIHNTTGCYDAHTVGGGEKATQERGFQKESLKPCQLTEGEIALQQSAKDVYAALADSPLSDCSSGARNRNSPVVTDREAVRAYLCTTCGSRVVGKDAYFVHLQKQCVVQQTRALTVSSTAEDSTKQVSILREWQLSKELWKKRENPVSSKYFSSSEARISGCGASGGQSELSIVRSGVIKSASVTNTSPNCNLINENQLTPYNSAYKGGQAFQSRQCLKERQLQSSSVCTKQTTFLQQGMFSNISSGMVSCNNPADLHLSRSSGQSGDGISATNVLGQEVAKCSESCPTEADGTTSASVSSTSWAVQVADPSNHFGTVPANNSYNVKESRIKSVTNMETISPVYNSQFKCSTDNGVTAVVSDCSNANSLVPALPESSCAPDSSTFTSSSTDVFTPERSITGPSTSEVSSTYIHKKFQHDHERTGKQCGVQSYIQNFQSLLVNRLNQSLEMKVGKSHCGEIASFETTVDLPTATEKPIADISSDTVCNICHSIFETSSYLRKHAKTHEEKGKPNFICSYCPKRFERYTSKEVHERSHTGKNVFQCKSCRKIFIKMSFLRRHEEEVHATSFPLKCSVCDKRFCSERYLSNHVGIHGDKNQKCSMCSYVCHTSSGLRTHVFEVHSRKPTMKECSFCGIHFKKQYALQRHMHRKHSSFQLQCHVCSIPVSCKEDLRKHIQSHSTKSALTCDVCLKSYTSSWSLQRHKISSHSDVSFSCTYCSSSFTRKDVLLSHLRLHRRERSFQCKYCLKFFSKKSQLDVHMDRHTLHPKYTCDVCGKKYKFKVSLRGHSCQVSNQSDSK